MGGTLLHGRGTIADFVCQVAPRYGYDIPLESIKAALPVFKAAKQKLLEKKDPNEKDFHHRQYVTAYRALCLAVGIPKDDALRIAKDVYDLSGSPQAWIAYSDVHPALTELSSLGYNLGVVSNWDAQLPKLLEALGLSKYFSLVIASQEAGVAKPELEIFSMASDAYGLAPEQCVYVGNEIEFDTPCVALGMDSYIIDRMDELADGIKQANALIGKTRESGCVRRIESLSEIAPSLAAQKTLTQLYWQKVSGENS